MAHYVRLCLVFLTAVMVWNTGLAEERQTSAIEIVDWGLTSAERSRIRSFTRYANGSEPAGRRSSRCHANHENPGLHRHEFRCSLQNVGYRRSGVLPITVVVFHPMIKTPDGRSMLKSSWPDSATSAAPLCRLGFRRETSSSSPARGRSRCVTCRVRNWYQKVSM